MNRLAGALRVADRAPGSEAGRDLLAHPDIRRRLLTGLLVVVASLPVAPPAAVAAWFLLWLGIAGWEQRIAGRRGYVAADVPGLLVTWCLSLMCALAAATLIALGDGGGRLFAVALICLSSVNIVLRFYAAPRMLLAAISPHVAVLALVCLSLSQGYWDGGEPLETLTPAATLAIFALLLWPARNKLLEAWTSLVEARDLAESRRHDAERASAAKSAFLATMSHEIRTPLNGVLGMVQVMYAEATSLEQRQQLRVIRRSGETLMAVLDDVLDMARIEAGQLAIEPVEFDMEHVVRGALATIGPAASKKGLSLAFSVAGDAKGRYLGDALRIRQILHNLGSNAVKFTDRGGVAVSVSYVAGELRVEVADSGCGIPSSAHERIFERFVQLDASATRRGGAGLGLAICRELAGLLGGAVTVSSAPGKGSVFTAVLPLEKRGESQPPVAPEDAESPPQVSPAIRVLAAEDNEVNRIVLQALLSQADVRLTTVGDGAQAVAAWRAEPWDVVLMDIQMPVLDGVSATREIRALEAAAGRARTPIIAVTANVLPEQQARYRDAGMDLVVAKPIAADALFKAVEQALESAPAGA